MPEKSAKDVNILLICTTFEFVQNVLWNRFQNN